MWPFNRRKRLHESSGGTKDPKERMTQKAVGTSAPFGPLKSRLTEQFIGFPNVDEGTEFDDKFFRRLGELGGATELPIAILEKSQRLSVLLYRKNSRAWQAIEIVKDFALSPGIRVRANDSRVAQVILDHWAVNRWQKKLPERVRTLALMGELLMPTLVNKDTGMVKITTVDPFRIRKVVRSSVDAENLVAVKVNLTEKGNANVPGEDENSLTRFELVDMRDDFTFPFDAPADSKGLAFFFAVNRISGGARGVPDLTAAIDWMDGLDVFTYGLLERAAAAHQLVWDLEIEGADESECNDMTEQFVTDTKFGGAFGHNEKVKVSVKAPQLGSFEAEVISKMMLRNIHAGVRMGGMFFGDSEDLTRAAASEMAIPTGKAFEGRQNFIRDMLVEIFAYQIKAAKEFGDLPKDADETFEIFMPRIYLRDATMASKALVDVTNSLQVGEDRGWVTGEQAKEVYQSSLEQMGALSRDGGEGDFLPVEVRNVTDLMRRAKTNGSPNVNAIEQAAAAAAGTG